MSAPFAVASKLIAWHQVVERAPVWGPMPSGLAARPESPRCMAHVVRNPATWGIVMFLHVGGNSVRKRYLPKLAEPHPALGPAQPAYPRMTMMRRHDTLDSHTALALRRQRTARRRTP